MHKQVIDSFDDRCMTAKEGAINAASVKPTFRKKCAIFFGMKTEQAFCIDDLDDKNARGEVSHRNWPNLEGIQCHLRAITGMQGHHQAYPHERIVYHTFL